MKLLQDMDEVRQQLQRLKQENHELEKELRRTSLLFIMQLCAS